MDQKKNCRYCGEEILAVAIKCKHCQSMLATADDEESKRMAYFRKAYEQKAERDSSQDDTIRLPFKLLTGIIIAFFLFLYFKNEGPLSAEEKTSESNLTKKETNVTTEKRRTAASSIPQSNEPLKKESADTLDSDREAVQDVAAAMEALDIFKHRNPAGTSFLASIGATAADTPTQLIQLSQAFLKMPDYLAFQYADILGIPESFVMRILRKKSAAISNNNISQQKSSATSESMPAAQEGSK